MYLHLSIAAFFSIAILGCNEVESPRTVEVTGWVTFDGKPVDGANVIFHPESGDGSILSSQATTDSNGRFELRTHIGTGKFKSGIVPGKYAVAITKLNTAAVSNTLGPPSSLLPKKYGDTITSGLTADVAENSDNQFDFALDVE